MKNAENKIYSQNGEDGVLAHIFDQIGVTNKIAVEIGVSDGGSGLEANTRLLAQKGWRCVWFDMQTTVNLPPGVEFVQVKLTADNVCEQFAKAQIPSEFDLLSIDIDGNDYHLREALHEYRPRVCVMEYNGSFDAVQEYVMPRDDDYQWQLWERNFGASLQSLYLQQQRLGYDLVYCESQGVNAFFVRQDCNVWQNQLPKDAWVQLWWAR